MTDKKITTRGILTFLFGSLFGIWIFLWPTGSGEEAFSTPLSLMNDAISSFFEPAIDNIMLIIPVVSMLGALLGLVMKKWVPHWLKYLVVLPWPYFITRLIAGFVAICVFYNVGPEAILNENVGVGMIDLSKSLLAIAFSLSFVLPFLTDCGLMEFAGILLRPVTRPLFKVPGRASIDLIASWLASSNTAVLITGNQYHSGFYTRREAAIIMTNFSLVSIPFCLIVAKAMDLSGIFLPFYLSITVIGLLLAVIGCRTWPISAIPDEYKDNSPSINENDAENRSLFRWAFEEGVKRAATFDIVKAFRDGVMMALSIIFDLIPIVIAWGTVGSLIVNYTSFFHWISFPMGWYMSLFGVPEAYAVAPATIVGFIDMFIPVLITGPGYPELTRFVIAGLSVIQILYMTEVGSIIIQSGVGINMWHLVAIFMQRTIISIPLLVLAGNLLLG